MGNESDFLQAGKLDGMDIKDGFIGSIGNTPLIRLSSFSAQTGCEILGKAEFLNPGGSVKDRAALYIIKEAEEKGLLMSGGTVVEGTAGNTGIGLAHICNARGYKCLIIIPDTQSQEKIDLLRTLGAEVRTVPAVPYKDPNNYVRLSGRVAAEMDNAIWANQFDNLANRRAHYETTGPEIWQQTHGKVDGWVAATGTGGTYAGVAMYLKEKNPAARMVLADPMGSALYSYAKTGETKSEGSSITEGIGNSRVTANMEDVPIDDAIQIDDSECLRVVYQLLRQDGLFMGGSVGINVAAAVALAKQMGPGHTIVTVLCDGGARYQSRLFNPEWLATKGLSVPE
jgi:cysteine synthase